MAVKVMVAPAIVRGEIERELPAPQRRAAAPGKPRRRRSAVYDADGNEVLITLVCQKCHRTRPLSLFGLRRMSDGTIRNQPWCRNCRSGTGAEKAGGTSPAEDSPSGEASPGADPSPAVAADTPRRNVAAEVAAALAAGRG